MKKKTLHTPKRAKISSAAVLFLLFEKWNYGHVMEYQATPINAAAALHVRLGMQGERKTWIYTLDAFIGSFLFCQNRKKGKLHDKKTNSADDAGETADSMCKMRHRIFFWTGNRSISK